MSRSSSATPVWTGAWCIENTEVEVPAPGVGAVLLRVEAAGLCGTDRHLVSTDPPYPMVLGHEICGQIVEFGAGAPREDADNLSLAVGDRVALFPWVSCGQCWACTRFGPAAATCTRGFIYGVPFERTGVVGQRRLPSSIEEFPRLSGGYGEFLYVHPGTSMWRMQPSIPPPVAALLDPLAVAVRSVDVARTAPDAWDNVINPECVAVVQGGGPVGLLTAIALREAGVGRVSLIGSRAARLAMAEELGVDLVLDVRSTTPQERRAALLDITLGRGPDLVIDCTNQPAALSEALSLVRRMGTVVETGNVVNSGQPIPVDPASDICQKNTRVIGMSSIPVRAFATAAHMLQQHERIPFGRLVTHRFHRSRALEAVRATGSGDAIKVVLVEEGGA